MSPEEEVFVVRDIKVARVLLYGEITEIGLGDSELVISEEGVQHEFIWKGRRFNRLYDAFGTLDAHKPVHSA
jgi:hypothetical protein